MCPRRAYVYISSFPCSFSHNGKRSVRGFASLPRGRGSRCTPPPSPLSPTAFRPLHSLGGLFWLLGGFLAECSFKWILPRHFVTLLWRLCHPPSPLLRLSAHLFLWLFLTHFSFSFVSDSRCSSGPGACQSVPTSVWVSAGSCVLLQDAFSGAVLSPRWSRGDFSLLVLSLDLLCASP